MIADQGDEAAAPDRRGVKVAVGEAEQLVSLHGVGVKQQCHQTVKFLSGPTAVGGQHSEGPGVAATGARGMIQGLGGTVGTAPPG